MNKDDLKHYPWDTSGYVVLSAGLTRTMTYKITATLNAAVWSSVRPGSIYGYIQGDTEKRFRDGEGIFTSTVMEDLRDGLYRTRNSIYKVNFHSEAGRPEGL